jgi:hypothetical protein
MSSSTTSPRRRSPRRNEVDDEDEDHDERDEDHDERLDDANNSNRKILPNKVTTSSRTEDSTLTVASSDTVMYRVMADAKVESFADLEDINPIVEMYEQRIGNSLRIKRSINGK